MTIKECLTWFDHQYVLVRHPEDSRSDYYCGITNDLKRKAQEHCSDFIASVVCDSEKTARTIENGLKTLGFDTGLQLGNDEENSLFVYMYRKVNGQTKE